MSNEDDIERERAAVERLHDALEMIRADLQWYWHWGDGHGGYLLSALAAIVREEGYTWPFDRRLNTQGSKKAASLPEMG